MGLSDGGWAVDSLHDLETGFDLCPCQTDAYPKVYNNEPRQKNMFFVKHRKVNHVFTAANVTYSDKYYGQTPAA